jgi:hypothetical protein
MSTKALHEILAAEKGVRQKTNKDGAEACHNLQRPQPLVGVIKVYTPNAEDGQKLPGQHDIVQVRVPDEIARFTTAIASLVDILATKELGNTVAKADLVLPDGTVIAKGVPATTLLMLEKQVDDLAAFIGKLPTLPTDAVWTEDTARSGRGVWATVPVTSTRQEKVPTNHVKAAATDKHPAQVDVIYVDQIVGTWETTRLCGALPIGEVRALKERVGALAVAVKQARTRANETQVEPVALGAKLMSWVVTGTA